MEIRIFFTINTINYEVPWDIQHKLDRLRYRLKKYIIEKQNGILYYEMNENNSLYNEAKNLKCLYPSDIKIDTKYKVNYTQDELEKAVAFIPDFEEIHLEEYGDDNLTHIVFCETCENSKLRDRLIANPDGKTKRLHCQEQLIKCGEQIDEIYGISKYMFDKMSDSYLKKGFKPIYSKRGAQPFGYGFYGENEIELYNDNYYYKTCKNCGTIYAEEKRGIDRHCEFYVLKNIDFKKIPVCFSQQYYYGYQWALISPELYRYIISRIKDAKFIPVFLKK